MDQYAVYWMLTPLCVLNCGYCFRDCSPASVASELSLENKKKAVEALYRLNVRKLTLGDRNLVGARVTQLRTAQGMKQVENRSSLEGIKFLTFFL